MGKDNIDKELDEELSKESINNEEKKKERRLFASEIADRISENLKPLIASDNSEKIIEAIKENKPIVNVEPPIVKTDERKYEIKSPDVIVPEIKVPKTVVNLKPNIKVKASDVKIPKIMEVRGFMDFAKLAMSVIKNKLKIDATKEDPLPVQLVHDNKFYEAIGGGGGPRSVWLKKKGSAAQLNPATEDKQDDIIAKELIGNSAVDGSGSTHYPIVDSNGRLQTRGFRDSAGDGRRMLVDSDRHGQVDIVPLGTPTTTALTLTTLNTAYKLPASELADRRTLIIYNVSDTDMFIGSSVVTTTTGILLPAGGTMNFDVGSGLYAICGTAGKIINILELK